MKITYDPQADAVYIYFNANKIKQTLRITDWVNVDLDEAGNVRGIEVIAASRSITELDHVKFMVSGKEVIDGTDGDGLPK